MSQSRSGSSRSASSMRRHDGSVNATRAPSRALATPSVPPSLAATQSPSPDAAVRADDTASSSSSIARVGLVETLAKQLQLAQDKLQRLEQQFDTSHDPHPYSDEDGEEDEEAPVRSGRVVRSSSASSASLTERARAGPRYPAQTSSHQNASSQHGHPQQPHEARANAFFDRAQEVLGDYETTVREGEDRSLRLLQERLETMELQWRSRLAAFQEAKETYEAHIADVIQQALKDRDGALSHTAQRLHADFDAVAQQARQERATLEQQVLQQADEFRKQYKAILDEDYAERCRALEVRVAERERQWTALIHDERRKAMEVTQARDHTGSEAHLAAVKQALNEVSHLRDELVAAHATQEKNLLDQYTQAAAEQSEAHQAALRDCSERAQRVQRECAETLLQMHRKVESLQAQLTAKEAGIVRADNAEQVAKTEKLFEHVGQVRKEVEAQWQSVVDGLRHDYESRLARMAQQHDQRVEQLRDDNATREREATRALDERVIAVEEAAEARWTTRLAEAQRTSGRQLDVVQALRQANEELAAKLDAAVQSQESNELAHQAALVALKQKQDEAWQGKLEQMRERYDALLQRALQEQQGAVSQSVYDQTLERLHAMEERAVHAQEDLAQQVREAVTQTETLWRQRLREAEQRASTYEVQLQGRYSTLRQQLYQTVSEHEKTFSDNAEVERRRVEAELVERCQLEQERLEARHEEAMAALKAVYASRLQDREAALDQQEALLSARETALTEKEHDIEERVRVRAQQIMEAASASLQAELDAQWDALREEKTHLDARRSLLQQELTAEYEGRLAAAKRQAQQQQATMAKAWLQFQDERQALWEQSRAQEQACVRDLTQATLRAQHAQHQRWTERVTVDSRALVAAVDARTREHGAQLLSQWKAFQAQLEDTTTAAAAQAARELTSAHAEQMKAMAAQSADAVCARWRKLEESLLVQSRDAVKASARLESALKAEFDAQLQDERTRAAEALATARREAKEALQEARREWSREASEEVKQLQAQLEALQQRHDDQQRAHEAAHATLIEAMSARYDELLARQREQAQSREDELARGFDRLQRQTSETAGQHTQQLRDTYEKKLKALADKEAKLRADHAQALAQAATSASREYEAVTRTLEQQYAQSLATLQAALTRKTEALAASEAGLQRRVAEQVMALESTMEAQYAAFVVSERHLREEEEAETEARLARRIAEAVEAAKQATASEMTQHVAAERRRREEAETQLAELVRQQQQQQAAEQETADRVRTAATQRRTPLQALGTNSVPTAPMESSSLAKARPLLTVVRQPPPLTESALLLPPRSVSGRATPTLAPARQHQQPQQQQNDASMVVSASQWNRLRQLWQVCEVAEDEVESFVARVERLPLGSTQVAEVEDEVRRLEARLPLMELVAQRELLREQLSGGQIRDAQQRRTCEDEERRLTQALLKELPAFETRHGQLFKFRGERLMDTILADEAF